MDQKAKFRHTGGYFCMGKALRISLFYPLGEPFGDFYEKLAAHCREWAEKEFSDHAGAVLTYRFCAHATASENGIHTVACDFRLSERGRGTVARNNFTHLWRADGCIVKEGNTFLGKLHKK